LEEVQLVRLARVEATLDESIDFYMRI